MSSTHRTARCGPACRVVWEGNPGAKPGAPIPIGWPEYSVHAVSVDGTGASLTPVGANDAQRARVAAGTANTAIREENACRLTGLR